MESKFGKEQDMKLNRFAALTIIALLAIGAMGLLSTRYLAKAPAAPVGQAQVTSVAPGSLTSEQPGVEEPAQGPDTDTVEEQVGEQVEDGQPDGAEAPGVPDESVQEPSYASSVAVDQAQTEGMSETDEAAALQDKATLSAADAETAALVANPGVSVVKTELDNENGALVYSVELRNGSEVKVDAGNGAILFSEAGGDHEG
jgi:hypothetical protein